jgi:hypothetical protein
MRQIPEVQIINAGWKALERVWKGGNHCADCEHFEGYEGSYVEPPYAICHVEEAGENPFSCPGVKRQDILDDLEAAAEEAAERSQER